jgi:ABC-type antimicrobial peptide transport system ATPase subunit
MNKRRKNNKLYLTDELSQLLDVVTSSENEIIKCYGSRDQRDVKLLQYLHARARFNKRLRQCEREYRRLIAEDIATTVTQNPNECWDNIKRLGPRQRNVMPEEVVDTDGNQTHVKKMEF